MQSQTQNPMQMIPLQGANPLDELAGVTLGEPISWWPLAWGWWLIIALIVIVIGLLIFRFAAKRKSEAAKRQALKDLKNLDMQAENFLPEAHAILKACVIAYWPKSQVASLNNQQWKTFLFDKIVLGQNKERSKEQAQSLSEAISSYELSLYASAKTAADISNKQVAKHIEQWIKLAIPPSAADKQLEKSELENV